MRRGPFNLLLKPLMQTTHTTFPWREKITSFKVLEFLIWEEISTQSPFDFLKKVTGLNGLSFENSWIPFFPDSPRDNNWNRALSQPSRNIEIRERPQPQQTIPRVRENPRYTYKTDELTPTKPSDGASDKEMVNGFFCQSTKRVT